MSLALVAGFALVAGCDLAKSSSVAEKAKEEAEKAKEAAEKAKEGAEKAKEGAEKAKEEVEKNLADAKEGVMKPIADALPKIEEKIKDLTGDKKTAALAKLDELKKSLSNFKTIDAAKMGEAKDKLLKAFDELKKMVGL